MKVRVCGPNLNDQSRGTFHVHRDGCNDLKQYGPGRKYGGDVHGVIETPLVVDDRVEVVEEIYSDQLHEAPDVQAIDWLNDFWFAPCCDDLPERGEIMADTFECWAHSQSDQQHTFAKLKSDNLLGIIAWLIPLLENSQVEQHIHIVGHHSSEYTEH